MGRSVHTLLKAFLIMFSYHIVVISNQGGISLGSEPKAPKAKLMSFKTKVSAVLSQLNLPINIYAATGKDMFRKPRTGMWTELLEDYDIHSPGDLDLENSIFVGDAGGRHALQGKPKDFSCSDRYILHVLHYPFSGGFSLASDEEQELCRKCRTYVPHTRGVLPRRSTKIVHAHFGTFRVLV